MDDWGLADLLGLLTLVDCVRNRCLNLSVSVWEGGRREEGERKEREGGREERKREGGRRRKRVFQSICKNNFCSNNSRDFTKNSDKFSMRTKKAMA